MKLAPLLFSIPHSGVQIPDEADWLKALPSKVLSCDVDSFVDELYAPALKTWRIPSVIFQWHRYSVDANRFSEDISPYTVQSSSLFPKTRAKSPSDIHWHKTTQGDVLMKTAMSFKLHRLFIKKYFDPFHQKIKKHIVKIKQAGHPAIYLLDLHSMPSKGLAFHRDPGQRRAEIVVSDCGGKSCSIAFRDLVIKAYKKAGFQVVLNWPYKGGAITQTYGQPHKGQEALQVELNRKLYMDEKTKNKSSNYENIQNQLKKAIEFIVQKLSAPI